MRKSLWSAFMTLTLVAIAIVGCMMMFSGGKEIASSGRDATLIREIDNATIMDVHDYDYLRGLDDYESYAEEVQSAIDYDDTQSERIESAALGTAPKVQHASGVESRSERVARRRATRRTARATRAEARAESDAAAEAEARAQAQAKAKAQAKARAQARARANSRAQARARAGAASKSESKADAKGTVRASAKAVASEPSTARRPRAARADASDDARATKPTASRRDRGRGGSAPATSGRARRGVPAANPSVPAARRSASDHRRARDPTPVPVVAREDAVDGSLEALVIEREVDANVELAADRVETEKERILRAAADAAAGKRPSTRSRGGRGGRRGEEDEAADGDVGHGGGGGGVAG